MLDPLTSTTPQATSDFLNDLVAGYREGLPGCAEALIDAFEPLLNKYSRLYLDGVWDVTDRDVVHFLKMMSRPGTRNLERTAAGISYSIRRMYEPPDVRQELIVTLLETARKYNNVSRNFKYEASERCKEEFLAGSQVIDNTVDREDLEDIYHFIEIGAIDTSWVKGISAGDGWDQLTMIQRAIIKFIYHDGLAEAVAARKLKMSVRQLQRHNKTAKELLADYFGYPCRSRTRQSSPGLDPH